MKPQPPPRGIVTVDLGPDLLAQVDERVRVVCERDASLRSYTLLRCGARSEWIRRVVRLALEAAKDEETAVR